jgi:hypothetical protein
MLAAACIVRCKMTSYMQCLCHTYALIRPAVLSSALSWHHAARSGDTERRLDSQLLLERAASRLLEDEIGECLLRVTLDELLIVLLECSVRQRVRLTADRALVRLRAAGGLMRGEATRADELNRSVHHHKER